jgi:hypothetical protein
LFRQVEALRDQILTKGRHDKIYCVVTSHQGANWGHTRVPINESAGVVVFPSGGGWNHVERILKVYIGLDKKNIETIRKLESRWVFVHKQSPNFVVSEKNLYLL